MRAHTRYTDERMQRWINLLVVDDVQLNIDAIMCQLAGLRVRLTSAHNGKHALRVFADRCVLLVCVCVCG